MAFAIVAERFCMDGVTNTNFHGTNFYNQQYIFTVPLLQPRPPNTN